MQNFNSNHCRPSSILATRKASITTGIVQQRSKSRQRSLSKTTSLKKKVKRTKSNGLKKPLRQYKASFDMGVPPLRKHKMNSPDQLEYTASSSHSRKRRSNQQHYSSVSSPYERVALNDDVDYGPSAAGTMLLNYHRGTNRKSSKKSTSRKSLISYEPQSTFETTKELAQTKAKLYEYKFKLEKVKTQLKDTERMAIEFQEKFKCEQEKSDEFFTKAEKYKVVAKDYRRDNEKLKKQIEQYRVEIENYDIFMRNKENQETVQHKLKVKETFQHLKQLQQEASIMDSKGVLQQPIQQIFECLQIIQGHDNSNGAVLHTKINTESTCGSQDNNPNYISDGKHKYKISQDAIIYNSETLGTNYEEAQRILSQQPSHQGSFNLNYNPNRSSMDIGNMSCNFDSQREDHFNSQQYEILLKIQDEMLKIKEDSHKILEENQRLKEQNSQLEIDLEDHRNSTSNIDLSAHHQSLMPQYQEAFDQVRKANEQLSKKIEELESKGGSQKTLQDEISDMKLKMQKFEYENRNLRDERELFIQQIFNLENYNKNQEKMLSYFQSMNQQSQGSNGFNKENLSLQSQMKSFTHSTSNPNQIHKARVIEQPSSRDDASDLSKSQPYYTNRSSEAFVQGFTLTQNGTLQPSHLNNSRLSQAKKIFQMQHLQNQTESSLYIDTQNNEGLQINQVSAMDNEHLFSLSSTQPENQMKFSPISHNFMQPKNLDFTQQQLMINGKETFGQCLSPNMVLMAQQMYPLTATNQKRLPCIAEQMRIDETSSQEVTNRDKSGRKSEGIMSSNVHMYHAQQLSDTSSQHSNQIEYQEDYPQHYHQQHDQKPSCRSEFESDRSLENHIQLLRKQHQHSNMQTQQLQSQETFQGKSQQEFSKATTNKNSQRNKGVFKVVNDNKENYQQIIQMDDSEGYIQYQKQSVKQSSQKIKSPAFINQDTVSDSGDFQCDIQKSRQNTNDNQKLSYMNTGTMSQLTHAQSTNSNYMSERTMNLKKEITSLDEEIIQLQHSLKHALLKKDTNN